MADYNDKPLQDIFNPRNIVFKAPIDDPTPSDIGDIYNEERFSKNKPNSELYQSQMFNTGMKDFAAETFWNAIFAVGGEALNPLLKKAAKKLGLKNVEKLIDNINAKQLRLDKTNKDSFIEAFPSDTDEYKLMQAVVKELDNRLDFYEKNAPGIREMAIKNIKDGTMSREDILKLIGEISSDEYANTHSIIDGSKKGFEIPVFQEITNTAKKPLTNVTTTIDEWANVMAKENPKLSDFLLHAIEFFDPEDTYSHSARVKRFTIDLLNKPRVQSSLGMKLTPEEIEKLGDAFQLHDIGKTKLRLSNLLEKWKMPDKADIRNHEAFSKELLSIFDEYNQAISDRISQTVAEIAGSHHNYSKEQTSTLEKVLKAADGVDGMASERIYKDGMPPEKIRNIMYKWNLDEWEEIPDAIKSAAIDMFDKGGWNRYGYLNSPLKDIRENKRILNYRDAIKAVGENKYSVPEQAAMDLGLSTGDVLHNTFQSAINTAAGKHKARREAYNIVNEAFDPSGEDSMGLMDRKAMGFLSGLVGLNPWHIKAQVSKNSSSENQGLEDFIKYRDSLADGKIKDAASGVIDRWNDLSEDDREYFKDVFAKHMN